MARIAYFSLGSNIGDRSSNLEQAWSYLAGLLESPRISSVYESAALYETDQPAFLNAVVGGATTDTPYALLRLCLGFERDMGRRRKKPKGPRNIDLDLLLYGDMVIRTEDLQVPHAAIWERAFVLLPLLELDPDVVDPLSGRRFDEGRAAVAEQQIRNIGAVGALRP